MRDLAESTGNVRRTWLSCLVLATAIWAWPQLAAAQSIAGVVRDASDAILPGVTVEASSAALIQKARTAVTDGSGQYRITNLPPGTYTLTVALSGFSTVKRKASR